MNTWKATNAVVRLLEDLEEELTDAGFDVGGWAR